MKRQIILLLSLMLFVSAGLFSAGPSEAADPCNPQISKCR